MSSYGAFIMTAYLTVFVVLGGLTVASFGTRRKVQRELAARGLERKK